MKDNAMVFPLFIPSVNKTEYYSMMYYAMETLHNNLKNECVFDIIIYYYSPCYDIKNYKHFDGNENLFKDFSNIKFIEFPFHINKNTDVYFFKWKNIEHFFSNYKYEKVFITDADLIFYTDPGYIFKKYSNNYAYVLFEGSDKVVKKVLERDGIAGGQLMLSKKLYNDKIHNIYHKILQERAFLIDKAKKVLDNNQDINHFDTLSDQYALMRCLLNSGVELAALDCKDILYGKYACSVGIINNEISIISNTNILHYLGPYAYLFLPDRLKTTKMRQKYNDTITKNLSIYY
jgi:hypothetical protein